MEQTSTTTQIFLVRHGETEWNVAGRIQGHMDSPLTARGIDQARAAAVGLLDRGITAIISSDTGRAKHTADIIAEQLGHTVQTDSRLRERGQGHVEGMTGAAIRSEHPTDWERMQTGDPDASFAGGENSNQFRARAVACIEDLATRHAERTILVVTHGGVLSSLFSFVIGLPADSSHRVSNYNASINRLSY